MPRLAKDKYDVLANGTLVDASDSLEWNFVGKAVDAVGILVTGTFSGAEAIAVLGGTNLGLGNPATQILDPETGAFSAIVLPGAAGLYFVHSYQDTLALSMTGGTVSVTDIDVVIFTAGFDFYSDGPFVGTVQ